MSAGHGYRSRRGVNPGVQNNFQKFQPLDSVGLAKGFQIKVISNQFHEVRS